MHFAAILDEAWQDLRLPSEQHELATTLCIDMLRRLWHKKVPHLDRVSLRRVKPCGSFLLLLWLSDGAHHEEVCCPYESPQCVQVKAAVADMHLEWEW